MGPRRRAQHAELAGAPPTCHGSCQQARESVQRIAGEEHAQQAREPAAGRDVRGTLGTQSRHAACMPMLERLAHLAAKRARRGRGRQHPGQHLMRSSLRAWLAGRAPRAAAAAPAVAAASLWLAALFCSKWATRFSRATAKGEATASALSGGGGRAACTGHFEAARGGEKGGRGLHWWWAKAAVNGGLCISPVASASSIPREGRRAPA